MREILSRIRGESFAQFCRFLDTQLDKEKETFVITVNPETLMLSDREPRMRNLLLHGKITAVPDGILVVKAGDILGIPYTERITGVEVTEHLLHRAQEKGYSLYVYGSAQETLDRFREVLANRYPQVKVLGLRNGYTSDPVETAREIQRLQPDIVLAALGIPRQEYFLEDCFAKAHKGIYMGVGGSLDVLSGCKKRAPQIFIRLNLEWLYRIVREPRRLKRFYESNIKFLWKIRREGRAGRP